MLRKLVLQKLKYLRKHCGGRHSSLKYSIGPQASSKQSVHHANGTSSARRARLPARSTH